MPSGALSGIVLMNVCCVSRPARRRMPAAPANRLNTPMTASAESSVRMYGCALARPMNRNATTEPTSSSATASTIPMLPPRSPLRSIAANLRSWLTSCAAMMLLASYSAPNAPRESPAQCVGACGARKGSESRVPADFSMPHRAAQPHHVADHLGDRAVVLGWHLLVDLYGCVQRAGERRVFDHRNVVLGRNLADFQRDGVDAFGEADRRVHAAIVLQRDRVVRRIGDDHRSFRHRRHHALAGAGLPQLADL